MSSYEAIEAFGTVQKPLTLEAFRRMKVTICQDDIVCSAVPVLLDFEMKAKDIFV